MTAVHVVLPEEILRTRSFASGPGSKTLDDEINGFVLYSLYQKQPTRSLASYVNWLFYYTGTIVSRSTVSRYFRHGFPVRGGLCKPNLIPYDKFRPKNIEKAKEYIRILARLDPRRIKYADEKSLKGRAIFNKKARRDVVTNIIPAVMTDFDNWDLRDRRRS